MKTDNCLIFTFKEAIMTQENNFWRTQHNKVSEKAIWVYEKGFLPIEQGKKLLVIFFAFKVQM
ncbi:hypothetical protein [Hugenholtzia roseola]|uniref:hypothetical protein n=1 Tax=Hugenholtzia roseola TaxID=1002 RepID=UPI0004218D8C|nr:hypothetical protein [Hugenholtzia roseola]